MALFTSTYVTKVDRKGRVSVPAPFRSALDGAGGTLVYVKPNHALGAIDGLSEAWMEQIQDRIDELDIYSEERIALETREFAETTRLPLDPEGRMILPTRRPSWAWAAISRSGSRRVSTPIRAGRSRRRNP